MHWWYMKSKSQNFQHRFIKLYIFTTILNPFIRALVNLRVAKTSQSKNWFKKRFSNSRKLTVLNELSRRSAFISKQQLLPQNKIAFTNNKTIQLYDHATQTPRPGHFSNFLNRQTLFNRKVLEHKIMRESFN